MDYEYACKGGWSKDDPLVVHFNASSIQLDLKEQEKDPWKIVPLTSPPEVSTFETSQLDNRFHYRSPKLPSVTFSLVKRFHTVHMSFSCYLTRGSSDCFTKWI